MAPLPESRVKAYQPPFSSTGLDFFGPFFVRQQGKRLKRWGVIFVCYTTRAIRIELLESLKLQEFMCLLTQFICRHACVKMIHSDNATTFVGAKRELKKSITSAASNIADKGIEWNFNPPYAHHMSGVWERLIRTIKRHLTIVAGNKVLDDIRLRTLFAQVEFITNERPLTRSSDDPNDLQAITPNHFLCNGPSNIELQPTEVNANLNNKWKQVQFISECYWRRWIKDYMAFLQVKQKWTKERRDIQVNDVVLVVEDKIARGKWPIGRITAIKQSTDGHVRSAMVKTSNGVHLRPITRLCLLEEA